MPCYSPIKAWEKRHPEDNGNYGITFTPAEAQLDSPIDIPCGGCIGCRLDKAADWSTRATNELRYHDDACFITLTYNDDHLPNDKSINRDDPRNFLRRLRRAYPDQKIRYFGCGEYGKNQQGEINPFTGKPDIGRPHYHYIIYGMNFDDRRLINDDDIPQYESQQLEELWGKGFTSLGNADQKNIDYISQYTTKKINGNMAADHYKYLDPVTGEEINRQPEFISVSTQPGIGSQWFDDFEGDCLKGFITNGKGRVQKIPKYYKRQMKERFCSENYETVKKNTMKHVKPDHPDNSPERLKAREEVVKYRAARAARKRNL